jgi:pantoate--beta-alanine ligase
VSDVCAVRVVLTASELSVALDDARTAGHSVGLVPTMGALHDGHRSLVERAASECGFVAVTIFVNPLQFDDPADLDAYPRDLEADLEMLAGAGADVVFVPDVSEIYPDHPSAPATTVRVAGVSEVLEGKFRPGHFDGVATVVTKLFAMAGRCRAYFGEKDFQQVAVVRRLVRDLCMPVDVVACPTVREPDGLALSSRNARLDAAARRHAAVINRALVAGAAAVGDGEDRPSAVRDAMLRVLAEQPGVEPEYAEVVDALSMSTPERLTGEVRLLIAARVGNVRLIDNLGALVGVHVGDMPAAAMSTGPRVQGHDAMSKGE